MRTNKIKLLLYICFILVSIIKVNAQCNTTGTGLTATAIATPSSCPLNGSIAISITSSASGAPYTFTLSGSCLSTAITQSQNSTNYIFNALQGNCNYIVCISDAGGNIISKNITVSNTYNVITSLSISDSIFTNVACSKLAANITGGKAPYSYELFSGTTVSGTLIQGPQASNIFSNINENAYYTIRATDACGQSIVSTKNTAAFKQATMLIGDSKLESCTSIRELILLNGTYGGIEFQSNSLGAAFDAGLKFPLTIIAKNSNGVLISGYPYTINMNNFAGWGLSANTSLNPDFGWSPKIPNNPTLFPITFTYVDACGATASIVQQYNAEFSKAAYVFSNSITLDTSICPIKNCAEINLGGNYIIGNNYLVSLYSNSTGSGTPIQTVNYPAQKLFCNLNVNSVYYFKVHDPCLNKDTITSITTNPALPAFSVSINNCSTYCDGAILTSFTYTGLFPNKIIAQSGPVASGPYPKLVNFSAGLNTGIISGLSAGTYNLIFSTKCGESANAVLQITEGNLTAQPIVTITPTGCASATVKITPRVSATGQMLAYHLAPGCHSAAGVAYYANVIFGQVTGGAPLPGSTIFNADSANSSYTVNVITPGTYVAIIAYSQGLPGVNNSVSNCYQTVRDTFVVQFNTIPTIVRVYTLPCSAGTYSIVPIAPNAVAGTQYTLYAANGTTIIAGPQVSNTFSNINVSSGTNLIIKAIDPCGQSSIVPFSITTSTTISAGINCLNIGTNSSADSLYADFINGATYTWTAPNNNTYIGNNPPLVIPSQTGVWTLVTTIQSGPCTAVLNNTFTTVACNIVPPPPPPLNDTIKLNANATNCTVTINWTTNAEVNSVRFDIEESRDGINWYTIATKAAAGNSSSLLQYSITHIPQINSPSYYRIKLINTGNGIKYSNIVQVNFSCSNHVNDDILTIDNNPAPGNIGFQFYSTRGRGQAWLLFVDAIGRQYYRKPVVINSGINNYSLTPKQYLANGTYFVRLYSSNEVLFRSNTLKFILLK